jgi:hypothetical protein
MQAATRTTPRSRRGNSSGVAAWAAACRSVLPVVRPKPQRARVREQPRQVLYPRAIAPRPASPWVMLTEHDVRRGSGGLW